MTSPRLAELLNELDISLGSLLARGLQECEEARHLEVAELGSDGREHLLISSAVSAWRSLSAEAHEAGISLFIVSAFRSIERQAEIIRRKLDMGSTVLEILTLCAPPGFSEHHTGRAVDVSTVGSAALKTEFEKTIAYAWLAANANRFGFYLSYPRGNTQGYQCEPWHWCYRNI